MTSEVVGLTKKAGEAITSLPEDAGEEAGLLDPSSLLLRVKNRHVDGDVYEYEQSWTDVLTGYQYYQHQRLLDDGAGGSTTESGGDNSSEEADSAPITAEGTFSTSAPSSQPMAAADAQPSLPPTAASSFPSGLISQTFEPVVASSSTSFPTSFSSFSSGLPTSPPSTAPSFSMPSSSSTLGGFDQQSFGVIALLIVALVVVFCTWQSCQAWRRRREMYHLQVQSDRADAVLGDMQMVPNEYDDDDPELL